MFKVTFNGLDYRIFEVDEDDDRLRHEGTYRFGICYHKSQEIFIMKTISAQQKRRVLIHELTHIVLNASGMFSFPKFNHEQICEIMAYNADFLSKTADAYEAYAETLKASNTPTHTLKWDVVGLNGDSITCITGGLPKNVETE